MSGYRVEFDLPSRTKILTAKQQYRCDGHLNPRRHVIGKGERYVRRSLPPNSEIGNTSWWTMRVCMDCAPVKYTYADATQQADQ